MEVGRRTFWCSCESQNMNNEVGSASLTKGRISECRISAKEQSDCDGFENDLLSQCPLTFDFANSAILLGLTYLLGHMYVRVYIYIRAHMYARCKYYISVNAPKKSVLAGFPTQTHLKAGGAKLRLGKGSQLHCESLWIAIEPMDCHWRERQNPRNVTKMREIIGRAIGRGRGGRGWGTLLVQSFI